MAAERRKQFTFYASYYDALMKLPKRRRWPTALAMIRYALEGAEPEEDSLYSPAAFMLMRPTIDSGRTKAQQKLRETREREASSPADSPLSPEGKKKKKYKYESEYEKEREEEAETENAHGGALSGAHAPRETGLSPCLPEREENLFSAFSGETAAAPCDAEAAHGKTAAEHGETPGMRLQDVETQEPFASMLEEDRTLRGLWAEYLLRGSDGSGPPSEAEKFVVLSELAGVRPRRRASDLRARLARAQAEAEFRGRGQGRISSTFCEDGYGQTAGNSV